MHAAVGFSMLSPSNRLFIQSTDTSPRSTLLASLHASVTGIMRRQRSLLPSTICVHYFDMGIIFSSPRNLPLNSDWSCTLALLTLSAGVLTQLP